MTGGSEVRPPLTATTAERCPEWVGPDINRGAVKMAHRKGQAEAKPCANGGVTPTAENNRSADSDLFGSGCRISFFRYPLHEKERR